MKTLAARNTVAASIALGFVALSAFASTSALASGAAGFAGQNAVTTQVLETRWNGQQGTQQTAIGGVLAQWHADDAGKAITVAYTPSGWGSPANLAMTQIDKGLRSDQKIAKAVYSYRPAAWGAPAELVLSEPASEQIDTIAMVSVSDSALKMHR